jgi:hypothetical protein
MVDASIVVVEQMHKKREAWEREGKQRDYHEVVIEAAKEVGGTGPSFFALLVIAVSFLPVLTLEAQEGRLFKPLAYTKNLTMIVAAVLAITDLAKQEGPLPAPLRGQRGNAAQSRGRSQASRSRDRLLEHPAHLGTDLATASTRSLCRAGRRSVLRPATVDPIAAAILFAGQSLEPGLSRQVRNGSQARLSQEKLAFFGASLPLAREKAFHAFLRTLFREDWVVYAKRPFGGPEHVLHYLARYTHRVAISNHRLVDLTDSHVTFLWKDYAHGSKRRTMTLTHEEFLRRFLEHVLPRGLPRIRYFGFLANRRRGVFLPLCRTLLAAIPPTDVPNAAEQPAWHCPRCQGEMRIIEQLTAKQIRYEETRHVAVFDTS